MGRFRLTIAWLLAFIVYCAVGFAALRSPSWLWASAVFSLVLATLLMTTLTAVYRRGERRAFWTGFALCGWLYLGLSVWFLEGSEASPPVFTTFLIDLAYPLFEAPPKMAPGGFQSVPVITAGAIGSATVGGGFAGGPGGPAPPFVMPSPTQRTWWYWSRPQQFSAPFNWDVPQTFRIIGHALLTPVFALLGGLWARRLYRTRDVVEGGEVSEVFGSK